MIKFIDVTEKITIERWNEIIHSYSNATVYHTFEWVAYLKTFVKGNFKIYVLLDLNSNKELGYLPGFLLKKFGIKIFASPFVGWGTHYMGPLINNDLDQNVFWLSFKKLMKELKVSYSELSNLALDKELAITHKILIEKRPTYISEVKSNPDDILESFSKSARRDVRRAMRDGLIYRKAEDTKKFADKYYNFLIDVFKKSNLFPTHSKERLEQLINLVEEHLLLSEVLYNNEVIACEIDLVFKNRMHYFGGSSSQEDLKLNRNELLRYGAMAEGAKMGAQTYDFSGGGNYKRKFNSEKDDYIKFIYSRPRILYKLRSLANIIYYFFNRVKRKLSKK